ncbi:allantoate amidohydrolase [Paenibacillus sp. BSR1-1]|uniref:allantoate amidohydrolase n=1 Tax=Paenibacillus sp. BSR1-1 TaxID=3020845 RepID=UPI0025B117A6|nr:allantoate amidohydrolase [Paenibacillus sp. BSR1-1]MDN3016496.1 allantoate amidohydrolase [Paenibacillus sp. BSR1-1]
MLGLSQIRNIDRIVRRLDDLSKISLTERGVTRLSFTKESEEANRLVSHWMEEAGMIVRRDALNNVVGRYEGTQEEAPVLLIGSHLDTVVEAGKYDGILGVILGIEAVQILHENGICPKHPIEVIGFCDEEGTRFHTTLLGSRAIAGNFLQKDLEAVDKDGVTLAKAMREIGMDPTLYRLAARDPNSILGYLELHIEQGPVLEKKNQSCSAVSGIAGQSRLEFRVEGAAGHAGTVPVAMRQDALVGTAEMIQAVERIALQYESLVATVGKLKVYPGASNVIPGLVEGAMDLRSIDDTTREVALKRIQEECQQIANRRKLTCEFQLVFESPAVHCSSHFIGIIESVLEEHHMDPLRLVSGAGHDAMAIAKIVDTGMIFVRCKEGLSHHPDEFASQEDIEVGLSVLLNTILKIIA